MAVDPGMAPRDLADVATARLSQHSRLTYAWMSISIIFAGAAVIAWLYSTAWPIPFLVLPPVIGLLATPRIRKADDARWTTVVRFDLVGDEAVGWEALNQALGMVSGSEGIWFTYQTGLHVDDYGGEEGEYAYMCERCTVRKKQPPYVDLDVVPYAVLLPRGDALYFLPNLILAHFPKGRRGMYLSFPYEAFQSVGAIMTNITLYHDPVPSDAVVVGRRWRYERKDGGPDLRYHDNHPHPEIATGFLVMNGPKSVYLSFNMSATDGVHEIAKLLRAGLRIPAPRYEGWTEHANPGADRDSGPKKRKRSRKKSAVSAEESVSRAPTLSPFEVLGVSEGTTNQEIDAAYRLKAQQYHPDKVATMGPELRELAERKMKEINAAYQALKGR